MCAATREAEEGRQSNGQALIPQIDLSAATAARDRRPAAMRVITTLSGHDAMRNDPRPFRWSRAQVLSCPVSGFYLMASLGRLGSLKLTHEDIGVLPIPARRRDSNCWRRPSPIREIQWDCGRDPWLSPGPRA